jgi:thiol-disulfide isomerase/thioredoxin
MKKYAVLLLLTFTTCLSLSAQSITGNLTQYKNQPIRLEVFNGLQTYLISNTTIDTSGKFELKYSKSDYGVGYLISADEKPFFVILGREFIEIWGEALSYPQSLQIRKGQENQLFGHYGSEHPKREQALSAWVYLQKIYQADSLFALQKTPQQAIETEIRRIKQEDQDFLKNLDPESYVSWYLPIRKLVSSVSTVAQYRTEEIPATLAAFRYLDYTDERLYKSGLLQDVIDSHYWLIENSGRSLDSVFIEMKISIDLMIENLLSDENKLNEITGYLFGYLEKHSLFQASEHLAIKVLTQNSCTVNDELAKQLESYRAMKIGYTAPDIAFSGDVIRSGSPLQTPKRLSDIQSAHTVVIFGASWCPKCAEELGQLMPLYDKWKSKGVEVVFVSLDTSEELFKSFADIFPFISMCDYKKWENQAIQDYYVFATPTMYLLDTDHKIILRPNSIKQVDAWIDYYLKGGKEE